MCKNPKFSVVIPVYNVGQYIIHCMESVIDQTLKDIEIICINDGSTDQSLAIVEKYRETDHRIMIIDKKNGGLASARNAGLKAVRGEYVLFVDSDDYLESNTCDRLYMEFMQTNADIVVFGAAAFPSYTAADNAWLNSRLNVNTRYYHHNTIKALFSEEPSVPFVWNKCYRRMFLEENNFLFDEELLYGEDTPFLFYTFPAAKEISFIADKLYNYRCVSEGSLMARARKDPIWKLRMHLEIVRRILSHWREKGYMESAMDEIYLWILDFFLHDLEDDAIPREDRREIRDALFGIVRSYGLHFSERKKTGYERKVMRKLSAI